MPYPNSDSAVGVLFGTIVLAGSTWVAFQFADPEGDYKKTSGRLSAAIVILGGMATSGIVLWESWRKLAA